MCRFAVQEPVLRAAATFHAVPSTTFSARWVELVGNRLAVEVVAQSSGEGWVLDLRALELEVARGGDWRAERILAAVTEGR